MRTLLLFWVLGGIAWGFSSRRPEVAGHPAVEVFYSGNREGEVDPCGCQVHQLGGLDRLGSFLKARPAGEQRLLVESGDSFFALPEVPEHRLEGDKLKARLMARQFKVLGLDGFSPGERDFAGGVEFLRQLNQEAGDIFLAANLADNGGKTLFRSHRIVSRGEVKIGLVGVVSPEALGQVKGIRVSEPRAAVAKAVQALQKEGARYLVLLSHLGLAGDREMAKAFPFDLIVGSHSMDFLDAPVKEGAVAIVQSKNQGQQIGRFRLGGPKAGDHQLTDLVAEVGSDASIADAIAQYKEDLRQLALKQSAHVAPADSKHPFVANPAYCKNCHRQQYDFWQKTKHSSAILVLYAKNQHFDPECIRCHSLGFQEPGGFADVTRPFGVTETRKKGDVPLVEKLLAEVFQGDKGHLDSRSDPARHRKLHGAYWKQVHEREESGALEQNYLGVQCEHCHGNRSGHPAENILTVKKVSEESCKKCHSPPHAAPYQAEMFNKVACPLSGKSS